MTFAEFHKLRAEIVKAGYDYWLSQPPRPQRPYDPSFAQLAFCEAANPQNDMRLIRRPNEDSVL
jgi:hypothetical protein